MSHVGSCLRYETSAVPCLQVRAGIGSHSPAPHCLTFHLFFLPLDQPRQFSPLPTVHRLFVDKAWGQWTGGCTADPLWLEVKVVVDVCHRHVRGLVISFSRSSQFLMAAVRQEHSQRQEVPVKM